MSGPPTRATNSVLNLTDPPVTKISIDSTSSPADPHPSGPGINMNESPLYNVRFPVDPHDAVNKSYVDDRTGGTEVGMMVPWPSLNPVPTGWILCDGTTIGAVGTGATNEDSEYEDLFNVLKNSLPNNGTEVWGIDTVRLPNMQGRTIVGLDPFLATNQDPAANVIGDTGGAYNYQLQLGEMPSHTHTGTADSDGSHTHSGSTTGTGNHTHSGSTNTRGDHSHTGSTTDPAGAHSHTGWVLTGSTGASGDNKNVQNFFGSTSGVGNHTHNISGLSTDGDHSHNFSIGPSGNHSHGVSITTDGLHTHTLTIGSAGLDQPHYNMQPYLVANWIIRYGAPGATVPPTLDFDDLANVSVAGAVVGDYVRFNGSLWQNRTAAQTRSDLSLDVGSDVQAWSGELDELGALSPAPGDLIQNVSGVWSNVPQHNIVPQYMVVNNPVSNPGPSTFFITPDTPALGEALATHWSTNFGYPGINYIIANTSVMVFTFTPSVNSYFIVDWRYIGRVTGFTPGKGAMDAIAKTPGVTPGVPFIGLQNAVFINGALAYLNAHQWEDFNRSPQISATNPGTVKYQTSSWLNLSRLDETGWAGVYPPTLPGVNEPVWPNTYAAGPRVFTAGTPYTIQLEVAFVTDVVGATPVTGYWVDDTFAFAHRALGMLIPIKPVVPPI